MKAGFEIFKKGNPTGKWIVALVENETEAHDLGSMKNISLNLKWNEREKER